jgi:hypothetical protein
MLSCTVKKWVEYGEKSGLLEKILILVLILKIVPNCRLKLKKSFSHMPSIYAWLHYIYVFKKSHKSKL